MFHLSFNRAEGRVALTGQHEVRRKVIQKPAEQSSTEHSLVSALREVKPQLLEFYRMKAKRQTGRRTDRQTDRETDRQAVCVFIIVGKGRESFILTIRLYGSFILTIRLCGSFILTIRLYGSFILTIRLYGSFILTIRLCGSFILTTA
jgi:hypothetical protein